MSLQCGCSKIFIAVIQLLPMTFISLHDSYRTWYVSREYCHLWLLVVPIVTPIKLQIVLVYYCANIFFVYRRLLVCYFRHWCPLHNFILFQGHLWIQKEFTEPTHTEPWSNKTNGIYNTIGSGAAEHLKIILLF